MSIHFKKRQTAFIVQLLIYSGLLFLVHSYLAYHFIAAEKMFFPLWHIYLFHIITTLIVYTLINYQYSKGNTSSVFNTFMLGTLLKFILAILFLLPFFLSKQEHKIPNVMNFFIPYFLFLSFEIYSVTQILNKQED